MTAIPGVVLYSGKSKIANQRVVSILTFHSENGKTGDMGQVWILPLEISPTDAIKQNNNSGACGNCALHGWFDPSVGKVVNRVCYVNVGQAPNGIWKAYQRGNYPVYQPRLHNHLIRGREIRLGAYGDPAALPIPLLRKIVGLASMHTGYSHQCYSIPRQRADKIAQWCMVSCENEAQHNECLRRGWRAFTVVRPDQKRPANSIECPHYSRGIQCIDCKLCDGCEKPKKSIYVIAHAKTGLNLGAVQDSFSAQAV